MLLEVASLSQTLQKWQDPQGPKIRVGALKDRQPVKLVDGARLTITTHEIAGMAEQISTTYQRLPQDVKPGDHILHEGRMEVRMLSASIGSAG